MKRFRLTTPAKVLIILLILALIAGGVFTGIKTGFIKTNPEGEKVKTEMTVSSNSENEKSIKTKSKNDQVEKNNEINLSLDEWIGWKSIIDANGGLTTAEGSIYDDLGIKVNISVINDATQSSNALIKGTLDAAGYTINRTAFLSNKFKEANMDVVMPYVTNYSNGGDGIIATKEFDTIDSLVNAKIGVPQFSEAHTLLVWFVNQSDLSDEDKEKIIDNLIFFETPDEAAKAFFAGKIDVAATWQPYLAQAESTSDCHILFSTKTSSKLIMDGILFNKDFAEKNVDTISKFIDGALQARDMYDTEFTYIKEAMPMFSGMTDEEIASTAADADLASWSNNMEILESDGPMMYNDMCDVWTSVGENVDKELGNTLFDSKYMEKLRDKYELEKEDTKNEVKVTEENYEEIENTEALLTKSATVNFIINTAKFTNTEEASNTLDEFIKIAKLLDGSIIQIEGNTDPNPDTDPEDKANTMLSKQRADTVKKYFVMNGISADRIITVGNGSSKPKYENDTGEHKALNRRTDVSFKMIE